MTEFNRRFLMVLAVLLSVLSPALGSFVRWGGWPPGFGVFPPQLPRDVHGLTIAKPAFSPFYFAFASVIALALLALLLLPTRLGFQPATRVTSRHPEAARLPWWFWLGASVNLVSWAIMWFSTLPIAKYAFTPLWWGFIVALDGVVYLRTDGASILARRPKQMLALTAMSVVGWFIFEWLNFFVLENWAYPNGGLFSSQLEAHFWFSLTFTCVWPVIFEFYTLFRSYPALTQRWVDGPRPQLGRTGLWLLLALGVVLGFSVGLAPYLTFFVVWLAPLLVLASAMALCGWWTPLSAIARGDWTASVLVALAGLASGFFWEFWNYGSNAFVPNRNPHFWIYDIPYVNVIHVFSEMPLLGYFGYLPFGIQCWVWWLVAAKVLNFDATLDLERAPRRTDAALAPGMLPSLTP